MTAAAQSLGNLPSEIVTGLALVAPASLFLSVTTPAISTQNILNLITVSGFAIGMCTILNSRANMGDKLMATVAVVTGFTSAYFISQSLLPACKTL